MATFADLRVDKVGHGYTLVATAPGYGGATSAPFDIASAAASRLAFSAQPTDTPAGVPLSPSVEVTVEDAFGNPVVRPGGVLDVTIGLANNPGGGTLSGATTMAAIDGVATFSSLSVDRVGLDYTLVAASAGLPDAISGPFDVTAGAPVRLAFEGQPSSAPAGAFRAGGAGRHPRRGGKHRHHGDGHGYGGNRHARRRRLAVGLADSDRHRGRGNVLRP